MKKYFYTVCCFLAATTFALTSCGDDETIIDEPDVPVTPENPDVEEPETPATTYAVSVFDLNDSSEGCVAGGDSIAFFAVVDEMLAAVQDSLTKAESTMRIETNDDHSFALIAESSNGGEFDALENLLMARLSNLGNEQQDFVYTGYCSIYTRTVTTTGDIFQGIGTVGGTSGTNRMNICIPSIEGTSWVTTAEDAAVQSIAFKADVSKTTGAYINGNQDVPFRISRNGVEVSLTATDNTYVFHFNETGTELTLVSINGEEVSETYVYTKETPAE